MKQILNNTRAIRERELCDYKKNRISIYLHYNNFENPKVRQNCKSIKIFIIFLLVQC